MNRALIAVVVLASCKDKPAEPPPRPADKSAPAAGSAAPTPALDVCKLAIAALERASCPTPDVHKGLMGAKQSFTGIVDTVGQLGAADPQKFMVICGQLLIALERDAKRAGCTLNVEQRPAIEQLVEAWYAQRTPVVPTGDAATDAVIAKMAALRDAACACRDAACLDALDPQLAAIGALPATAPEAARTLGSNLFGDAARCAQRVRTMTDPR
jgi:hypothetical protein